VRQQARDLRDREHEDEVEEVLERGDLMLGVERAIASGTRGSCRERAVFAITTRP
jgi:hypothetical protein